MPPKRKYKAVVRSTHTVAQRTPQTQTSGLFRLPAELLFEILSYFDDHLHYIRDICGNGRKSRLTMVEKDVERSTVIRKLTMTCRALRDTLLPVLWKNTEGCVVRPSPDDYTGGTYGLYAQCVYLASNPTIAAYVQVLSVDLDFKHAPKDLMKKFVDALVRLPNLRVLELLDISHRSPVTRGLKRKCAIFPTIREMTVCHAYPDFIRSCPNLECLTLGPDFAQCPFPTLSPYGAGLKRVKGVDMTYSSSVESLVRNCPNVQEVTLYGTIYSGNRDSVEHLRQAKHLSVVEAHFYERKWYHSDSEEDRRVWKMNCIDVLKNSPSKNRKFLRWKVAQEYTYPIDDYAVIEAEELEVSPELAR